MGETRLGFSSSATPLLSLAAGTKAVHSYDDFCCTSSSRSGVIPIYKYDDEINCSNGAAKNVSGLLCFSCAFNQLNIVSKVIDQDLLSETPIIQFRRD